MKYNIVVDRIKKIFLGSSRRENFVKNVISVLIGDTGSSIINIIFVIFLIRIYGTEQYGIFVISQTYSTIIDSLINLQCWKSIIKYGQDAFINNDKYRFLNYVKIGWLIDIFTAFIGSFIALICIPFISKKLIWDTTTIICAKILSVVIIFNLSGTSIGILRIFNKFNLVSIQKIVSSLLKLLLILIIYIFKINTNIVFITFIYAVSEIIGYILLLVFSLKELLKRFTIKDFFRKNKFNVEFIPFLKFTLWSSLATSADLPVQYFDVFFVSYFGNVKLVGVFKVLKQIVSIMGKIAVPINQSILPQFSEFASLHDYKNGYNIVIKIRNIILIFLIPISLFLGLTSPIWLRYTFGPIYCDYWILLLFYLLSQTIAISYIAIHPYFLSVGCAKETFYYTLISNILYLIILIVLIKKLGIWAVIISFIVQFSSLISFEKLYIKKNILRE